MAGQKWIQIIEYSPFNYGVAYAELIFGKIWNMDISMNLTKEHANKDAVRRQQISGLEIQNIDTYMKAPK